MSVTYYDKFLLEYPGLKIRKNKPRPFLDRVLNQGAGALWTTVRWGAREFCDPGLWIKARLCPEALTPAELRKLVRICRNDEWWGWCLIPIQTGTILDATGEGPFLEGITHVYDPSSDTIMGAQDLIAEDPNVLLGADIAKRAVDLLGYATALIVVKRFVNMGPIPFHMHSGTNGVAKPEVHDVIRQDNPTITDWHNLCHAIGLKTDTKPEDLLACLKRWGAKNGNGVLDLARWWRIPVGEGTFKCPPWLLHAPGPVATHETHWPIDQHGLLQDRFDEFRNPALTPAQAMGNMPKVDYPETQAADDWDHLMGLLDFNLNIRPDFMSEFFSPNAPAEEHMDTGVNAFWSCHGPCPQPLQTSILRLELEPGAHTLLKRLPSSGYFFLSQGRGEVAGLKPRLEMGLKFDGYVPCEAGWMSQQLVTGGVPVKNTSNSEPLVLTMSFQKEVPAKN